VGSEVCAFDYPLSAVRYPLAGPFAPVRPVVLIRWGDRAGVVFCHPRNDPVNWMYPP